MAGRICSPSFSSAAAIALPSPGMKGEEGSGTASGTATTFQPGVAAPLFQTHLTRTYVPYAAAPDGRFLLNTAPEETGSYSSPITVMLNRWAALKK